MSGWASPGLGHRDRELDRDDEPDDGLHRGLDGRQQRQHEHGRRRHLGVGDVPVEERVVRLHGHRSLPRLEELGPVDHEHRLLTAMRSARGGAPAVSTGAIWVPLVGYSRAVRVGPVGVGSGHDRRGPDPRGAARALAALAGVGDRAEHVVRTGLSVTDIARWEEVGRAHGEVFGDVRPALTMVEVSALIDPALLVEVEASGMPRSQSRAGRGLPGPGRALAATGCPPARG